MAAGQTEVLILAERTDVNVTFGMDKNLKLELERLLSKLGLDITEYFTMAARQAVIEQGIPFKVTMEIPNAETRQAMQDTLDGSVGAGSTVGMYAAVVTITSRSCGITSKM